MILTMIRKTLILSSSIAVILILLALALSNVMPDQINVFKTTLKLPLFLITTKRETNKLTLYIQVIIYNNEHVVCALLTEHY